MCAYSAAVRTKIFEKRQLLFQNVASSYWMIGGIQKKSFSKNRYCDGLHISLEVETLQGFNDSHEQFNCVVSLFPSENVSSEGTYALACVEAGKSLLVEMKAVSSDVVETPPVREQRHGRAREMNTLFWRTAFQKHQPCFGI